MKTSIAGMTNHMVELIKLTTGNLFWTFSCIYKSSSHKISVSAGTPHFVYFYVFTYSDVIWKEMKKCIGFFQFYSFTDFPHYTDYGKLIKLVSIEMSLGCYSMNLLKFVEIFISILGLP